MDHGQEPSAEVCCNPARVPGTIHGCGCEDSPQCQHLTLIFAQGHNITGSPFLLLLFAGLAIRLLECYQIPRGLPFVAVDPQSLLMLMAWLFRKSYHPACSSPHSPGVSHLMPRTRGGTSPLDRVPRVPPGPPRVCVPPRVDGAGTRDILDLGAGVWNLGAAALEDAGLSTKVVSVVMNVVSPSGSSVGLVSRICVASCSSRCLARRKDSGIGASG